ncbi:MAG: helix-hairpin-helix domain-containing protein [Planctomycetota bacterium]
MKGRHPGWAAVLAGLLLTVFGGLAWMLMQRGVDASAVQARTSGYRVPVNSATRGQLRALPGIGRVNAGYVVTHRDRHGPFIDAQSLTAVRMIGEKTAAAIEPWVVFD